MAGGIDWFRWHHGSVTDPKFQLVARKAGVGLPDVLAVWAFALEKASASDERGSFGELDCEAIDCLFGLDDGKTAAILEQMGVRGLVADGHICAWEKRQPKREREDNTAAQRQADKRARDAEQRQSQPHAADPSHVKPRHATSHQVTPEPAASHQKTPREEKSREEKNSPSLRSGEGSPRAKRKPANTPMPDDFGISERVTAWAASKGFENLPLHLEAFRAKVRAKGYQYVDWDSAFMEAIREDWAKLRNPQGARSPPLQAVNRQEALEARNKAVADDWLRGQGADDAGIRQGEILEADH